MHKRFKSEKTLGAKGLKIYHVQLKMFLLSMNYNFNDLLERISEDQTSQNFK